MKKFPILLLIIFLISSCSNDDSVIFEFEKEIVKSKHCLMVYDLNYNETYDCTNSVDTNYTINLEFFVINISSTEQNISTINAVHSGYIFCFQICYFGDRIVSLFNIFF